MNKILDKIQKAPLPIKLGVAAGLAIALTVLNFALLIRPLEAKIEKVGVDQRKFDQQLLEKKSIAQNLTERRREMEKLEQQLNEALTELPEKKDLDELLAQLNDVGRKSGLDISKIEPSGEVAAEFYSRIPIKISVQGNYHEIAMFMQEISSLRRIVNVNNIQLGNANLKNDKMILESQFQATTFRFLEQGKGDPKGKKVAVKKEKKG